MGGRGERRYRRPFTAALRRPSSSPSLSTNGPSFATITLRCSGGVSCRSRGWFRETLMSSAWSDVSVISFVSGTQSAWRRVRHTSMIASSSPATSAFSDVIASSSPSPSALYAPRLFRLRRQTPVDVRLSLPPPPNRVCSACRIAAVIGQVALTSVDGGDERLLGKKETSRTLSEAG